MSFRKFNKDILLNAASATVSQNYIKVSGKHGDMIHVIPEPVEVNIENNVIRFSKKRDIIADDKAHIGTFISLLNSSITGVNNLHESRVVFKGTGVSVTVLENALEMKLGKSHKVHKEILNGLICSIAVADVKQSILSVKGVDKGLVTRFASELIIKRAYKGGVHVFLEGKEPRLKEKKGA